MYAYVHDDPINFDDPGGTCDCSVRVRCRPAFGKVANFWHCYIVVKTRQGEYRTLTGGHDKDWMLAAWDLAGDPVGDNSFADPEYFYRQGAAMCNKVDCLRAKVPWVNGLGLQYHTFTQNSNSFVCWAMQLCGLPVKLPWWASGRDQ